MTEAVTLKPFDPEGHGYGASARWHGWALDHREDRSAITRESADMWWRDNVRPGGGYAPHGMAPPATEADVAAARVHYDESVGMDLRAAEGRDEPDHDRGPSYVRDLWDRLDTRLRPLSEDA